LADLAEAAAALQAKVNLHIGWAMVTSRPIPPELYDANAKLVDVTRQLHQAARQSANDPTARQAQPTAQPEAAAHGC
jgi:hypothetical protein